MTVDLRTRYLGLQLRSPIVASAAPQNTDPGHARRLAEAGVGAIVLPSLFEEEIEAEQIELNRSLEQGTEAFAEALDYFPALDTSVGIADRYLLSLAAVRAAVGVPVIASLNARTAGGWIHTARLIEEAGADALELIPVRSPVPRLQPPCRSRSRSSSARTTPRSPTSPPRPSRRAPTDSSSSTASTSRTSISRRSASCRAWL